MHQGPLCQNRFVLRRQFAWAPLETSDQSRQFSCNSLSGTGTYLPGSIQVLTLLGSAPGLAVLPTLQHSPSCSTPYLAAPVSTWQQIDISYIIRRKCRVQFNRERQIIAPSLCCAPHSASAANRSSSKATLASSHRRSQWPAATFCSFQDPPMYRTASCAPWRWRWKTIARRSFRNSPAPV